MPMTKDTDIVAARRRNLKRWIDQHFNGNQASFLAGIAERTGEKANQGELSGLLGTKSFGEKKARKLEIQASMPFMHLDTTSPQSVSRSDATPSDSHHISVRRVRIEGAVEMDDSGFWTVGSDEAQEASFPTEDPDAYAIRVTSQRFKPVVSLSQCLLVSPRAALRAGRPVVVTMADGRKTLLTFLSHESGVWNLTSVTDANDYLDIQDDSVRKVERVMAYLWTD